MDYDFTPIPNWFFPIAKQLKEAELRIMLAIWEQTVGWQTPTGQRKEENTLAYTFLTDKTGVISRTAIRKALESLQDQGLITRQPNRVSGQLIKVFPKTPILPVEVVTLDDSGVTLDHQEESSKVTREESSKVTHNKNQNKNLFKESNTMKLTPDQEESLALIVGVGLADSIARRLIALAWSRGRDISYIQSILGYVAKGAKSNPAGLVRTLIEQDSDVNPPSKGAQGLDSSFNASKWDHGGIHHTFVKHSCEICHPELIAQRQEREAAWLIEDGQDGQDGQP